MVMLCLQLNVGVRRTRERRSQADAPRISCQTFCPLNMSRLTFGIVAGITYGALTVGTMLPMSFPDKRAALLGAFLNRFAIGFLIPLVALPQPRWAIGLGLGILLSLPDAIITKAFAPIVGMGAIGGLLIGWLAGRYTRSTLTDSAA